MPPTLIELSPAREGWTFAAKWDAWRCTAVMSEGRAIAAPAGPPTLPEGPVKQPNNREQFLANHADMRARDRIGGGVLRPDFGGI
jgi:hypothetical protein